MQHIAELNRAMAEKRRREREKLVRQINAGRVAGKVHDNGMVSLAAPKNGRYNTRELVTQIRATIERNKAAGSEPVCHINNKWQLQVRGKDLRRVLKAMPNLRQQGRKLVEIAS